VVQNREITASVEKRTCTSFIDSPVTILTELREKKKTEQSCKNYICCSCNNMVVLDLFIILII
jgi:hypothetical protein